jgi:hypothetical protein
MRVALALVVLLVAACGVPREPAEQAEHVQSVAAEGALLAHGAAEGSATDPFVEVHARALHELLEQARPAIELHSLGVVAADVSAALEALAAAPGDEALARRLERDLEGAAEAAAEIAG